jgi:hypothetical protein
LIDFVTRFEPACASLDEEELKVRWYQAACPRLVARVQNWAIPGRMYAGVRSTLQTVFTGLALQAVDSFALAPDLCAHLDCLIADTAHENEANSLLSIGSPSRRRRTPTRSSATGNPPVTLSTARSPGFTASPAEA